MVVRNANNKGITAVPQAVVDGYHVWYQTRGTGDPLTVIGGFALQHDQFEFCTELLAARGYQVVSWDHRGTGKSERSLGGNVTLDHWVDDLRGVLDAAGIERSHIWATSTGSAIGLRFAARYPERTRALITYPWFKATPYWQELFNAVEVVCRMFGPKALARLFAGSVLPEALQYTEQQIAHERWSGIRYEQNLDMATLRAMLDALSAVDLTEDVARLTCPVLLLLGDDSALNKVEAKRAASYDKLVTDFLDLKADAELGTVVGAGSTYCMLTRPDDTVKVLDGYLRKLKQTGG